MQSDGNCFGGDVVLESVNMASKILKAIEENVYLKEYSTLKQGTH